MQQRQRFQSIVDVVAHPRYALPVTRFDFA
jgi:hypothetical protein